MTIQLDHSFSKTLKKLQKGLYRHLMKGDNQSEESVAHNITQDINEHFSGGYNIIWNDTLNHFMMNFDIIQILKNHIGFITPGLAYQ
jgi:hypothetical protein